MKILSALILILWLAVPSFATGLYQIEDIFNPDKQEDNESAINENFDSIWASKLDVSTPTASGKQYVVYDILNPAEADRNAHALNANFDDLWREKVGKGGVQGFKRFSITADMLTDQSKAEELEAALMQNFYDLFYETEDN